MDINKKRNHAKEYLHKEIAKFVHQSLKKNPKVDEEAIKEKCIASADDSLEKLHSAISLLYAHNKLNEDSIPLHHLQQLLKKNGLRGILKGNLPQEEFGFTDEQLTDFYQLSEELYQKKNYQSAADIFLLICILNPYVSSFWIGLGMANEMLGENESALHSYLTALEIDEQNLSPALYAISCLIKLNRKDKAKELISFTLKKSTLPSIKKELEALSVSLR